MLTKKLVIFLIRKKLGLRKYEAFRFANQKSTVEFYWFTSTKLKKLREDHIDEDSHVSLNWLLDDECEIVPADI